MAIFFKCLLFLTGIYLIAKKLRYIHIGCEIWILFPPDIIIWNLLKCFQVMLKLSDLNEVNNNIPPIKNK